MDKRIRILFITRKYPPSVGGMQRLSHQLVTHLRAYADVYAITWGGSQRWLLWFLLLAFVRGWFQARIADVLYAGDPLVAPVVALLAALYRKPTVVNVHRLDLTFDFPGYRAFISLLLRRFTRVVCISRMTYEEALQLGVASERCRIIYPGIELPPSLPPRETARAYLTERFGVVLAGRQVWLTIGRLVRRKGVVWFCDEVLPQLRDNTNWLYLIAGKGPEEKRLYTVITAKGLTEQVVLLGQVSDADLHYLYVAADLFIMPNIPQPHDREGFGLVAIEAAAYGTPVLAARLEGIQDAVIEGVSGYLLPPKDAETWAKFLQRCLDEPQIMETLRPCMRDVIRKLFGWDKIVEDYIYLIRSVIADHSQVGN